jgi:Flp pilus assembly pilin Flp
MNLIRRCLARGFLADEKAAVSSEHALLLTLIAVAIFAAVKGFGQAVFTSLWTVTGTLPFGS